MTSDADAMRRALKRLVQRCDRLTKGLDRAALDKAAKEFRGSAMPRYFTHALMRDIIDAANAGRDALARHDTAGQIVRDEEGT